MFIRYANYFGNGLDLIDWDIQNMCGYEPKTTYYTDFSIADRFGLDAIEDTFKRARATCKEMGVVWQTELCMVLNWKIWEHSGRNDVLAKLYDKLYWKYSEHLQKTLKGDDLSYFYRTTD